MKKILMLLSLSIGIISCQKEQQTSKYHYFSKLTGIISPFLEYKPRGEYTDSINRTNYYKVEYDRESRLSTIAYYKDGLPSNDSYFYAHRVKYDYIAQSKVRTYYNTEGKKSTMWRHYYLGDNIHKEVFELDDNSRPIVLKLYDSLGQRISNGLDIYEYHVEYINDSSFIQKQFDSHEKRKTLTDYFPFQRAIISTDGYGHLYRISNVDNDNKIINQDSAGFAEVIFDFDQHGNELAWRFYNEMGELSNRKPYKSLDFGYAQWVYQFDWIDEKMGWYKSFRHQLYNQNSLPVNDNFSVHSTSYKMNKSGNIIAVEYHDKHGNKTNNTNTGYHRLEINYDESGNRISQIKFDSDGNEIH
jgi:hypothetical protein